MKKITLLAMSFIMALTVKAQYGTDVTDLLTNPDFENGTEGWTITGGCWIQGTAANYGYNGTYFLENWTASSGNLADLDWSQTIEVPNGFYVVKSLAHSIKQSDESLVPSGVAIYANNDEVPVTTNTTNPPTEYIVTTVVTDGNLVIGYRTKSGNVNWTAWDNIRVYQYLAETTDEAKLLWVKDEMDQLAAEFENLLDYSMSQTLKDAISESMEAMEEVSTYAEADALWSTMKQQMTDAEACIEAYERLNLKVDETYEFADQEGADDLYDLLDEIAAKVEEGEYDTAGALAEIEAIGQAVYEFNLSNADGSVGFDVTERFVTNPTLRQNSNGWEGSKPGLEHEVMEFYNCDFDIYQELTDVPNGKYVVKVQGFYREAGNDSGNAYGAGTEEITAKLYANAVSQPLTSLYKYTAEEMGITADVYNGYVNMRYSTNIAFNTQNSLTGKNYYADNEVVVIVTDGTLKIGLSNKGHKGSSWCVFRDFELWYYGNFPAVNLCGKMEDIKAYLNTNVAEVPYAVNTEINDYLRSIQNYTEEGKYSDDEMNAVIFALEDKWAEAEKAITLFAEVKTLANRIENELLPLNYPGKNDLQTALEGMAPYLDEASTVNTYEGMQALMNEMDRAIRNYYFSQVATPEIAADYSFLLSNPNFEQKGNWTWSVVGGGSDQWNGGCRPSEEGGANRQGVNLWGWGIKSVDVHQVLTNLPDGLYKVSAEMITQNNCATDQHIYATGVSKATSKALTVTGWDTYEWAELITNDFAVVAGGRLSIGAESTVGGSNSEGWFQATNFKLYYHGPASAEQLKDAWENTEARANAALMTLLPYDREELTTILDLATVLADEEKYGEACALIQSYPIDSIVAVTKKFYETDYKELLNNSSLYQNYNYVYAFTNSTVELLDSILSLGHTTHKNLDEFKEKIKSYNAYMFSLAQTENKLAYMPLEDNDKMFIQNLITSQMAVLLHDFHSVEYCDELRKVLDETVLETISFTLTYTIDGEVYETYTIVCGSVLPIIEFPTKKGYTFSGWSEIPETMPGKDVIINGSFSINSYTLIYVIDDEEYTKKTVAYGTQLVAIDPLTKEGYTFSGWSEIPETMPAHDVVVNALFTKNKYRVTFALDGIVKKTELLEYGTRIEVPTLEGYTLIWSEEVPETVPAEDVFYNATCVPNIYQVYYFVGANLVHIANVTYGEKIPEYIYEPKESEGRFFGWKGEAYETMPAHEVYFTAKMGELNTDIQQLQQNNGGKLIIYDLQGRKVQSTENLKGGIYIINGRKEVIR